MTGEALERAIAKRRSQDEEPWETSWEYRSDVLALYARVPPAPYAYEVCLERMGSSAAVLDWICQVAKKTWATPEMVGHLVDAINDLMDPQATLCSGGIERRKERA